MDAKAKRTMLHSWQQQQHEEKKRHASNQSHSLFSRPSSSSTSSIPASAWEPVRTSTTSSSLAPPPIRSSSSSAVSRSSSVLSTSSSLASLAEADLDSEFLAVLDGLQIYGPAREAIILRTTATGKRECTDEELDFLFVAFLDERNIHGVARDNLMRIETNRKLDLIRQSQASNSAPTSPKIGSGLVARAGKLIADQFGSRVPLERRDGSAPPGSVKPFPNPRIDSLNAHKPYGLLSEQTPAKFVALLGNRNTPLKTLYRHLTALCITLAIPSRTFIPEFIHADAPHLGPSGVRGLDCLEIVLERVAESRRSKSSPTTTTANARIRPGRAKAPPPPSDAFTRVTYADDVLEDELRLETLRCIEIIIRNDAGLAAVLGASALVREMVYCLAAPDAKATAPGAEKAKRASLMLRTTAADVLGVLCHCSPTDGRELILNGLMQLAITQDEPARFHHIVASLERPMLGLSAPAPASRDDDVEEDDDGEYLSTYRTSIMTFINAIVGTPSEASVRLVFRREVEDRGLRRVMKILRGMNPSEALETQLDAYDEDRQLDLIAREALFREKNATLSDPNELFTRLLSATNALPDRERSRNLVLTSLTHITTLVETLRDQVSGKQKSTSPSDSSLPDDDQIADALAILEHSAGSIAGGVAGWPEMRAADRRGRFHGIAVDMLHGVEETAGGSIGVIVDGVEGPGAAQAGVGAGSGMLAVVRELESLKKLYNDNLAATERQAREIHYLRSTRPSPAGDPTPPLPPRTDVPPLPPRGDQFPARLDSRPPAGRGGKPLPAFLGGEGATPDDFVPAAVRLPPASGTGKLWEEIQRLEQINAALRREMADAAAKPYIVPGIRDNQVAKLEAFLADLKKEAEFKPAPPPPPPPPPP
ncbi:armadillo-type protein, partial [Blyttiomyces helicus]